MPSITINYSASEGTRFAAALGKGYGLMDNQEPPQPRAATAAECKAYVITQMKQLVINIEGAALKKAALDAVVVPAFDPT